MTATAPDALRQVPAPVLIAGGDRDSRSASAGELAALLPDARFVLVPGDHETALDAPELTTAVLHFLD
jgi:pimeloyl-ACP methyl ester carboxylesterase